MFLQDLLKKLNSFTKSFKISDVIQLIKNGSKDILIFVFSFTLMVVLTVFVIVKCSKDTKVKNHQKVDPISKNSNSQDVYLSFDEKLNLVQNVLVFPDSINKDLTTDYVNFITPSGNIGLDKFNNEIKNILKLEEEETTLFNFEKTRR